MPSEIESFPMRKSIALMALIGCAFAGESNGRLLTDFDSRNLTWTTVNDDVMGGRSEGGFESKDGVLLFRGSTNTSGGGFSSIRSKPGDLNLEGTDEIRLRVRGDGRTYTFRLAARGLTGSYRADFTTRKDEWIEVKLPFEEFEARFRGRKLDLPPPEPGDVVGVGFMIYDKKDGPFRLEVDWIRAYEPFDLADLTWKKRPLVVFAPTGDDARLKKQLDAVKASRADFDEREMQLVVVAPGRDLSKSERTALAKRLRVEAGAFAVLLVGKDGTVKRRAAKPVPMKEIYAEIDTMPMRRQEMKEGGNR
jgi:hypothetical protein